MKKLVLILSVLLLILCSCGDTDTPYVSVTEAESTETEAVVTADTELLKNAAGFTRIYDERSGALWITYGDINSGFFLRILSYNEEKTSLRLFCTDSDSFVCGGQKYDIADGSMRINGDMLNVLRSVSKGGDCKIGGREPTEDERAALLQTITLYEAALGAPYIIDTGKTDDNAAPTAIDENGNAVYENERYSITFPASFHAEYENERLVIISGVERLRSVTVFRTGDKFSASVSDDGAVRKSVEALGGKLVGNTDGSDFKGRRAFKYTYELDGVYINRYYIEDGDGTYVLSAASYDKNDRIPQNIVSTFEIK